jgi:hypothetical protein
LAHGSVIGVDKVNERLDLLDAALRTLDHRNLVMNGQVDRLKAQSDILMHRLSKSAGNGADRAAHNPFPPAVGNASPTLHFLVVYDFTHPGSRSFTLAAAQLRNFARYLSPKPTMAVCAICLGAVPEDVEKAAIETETVLRVFPHADIPVANVVFSHKLHVLSIIEAGNPETDRYLMIDHDVFLLERPIYLLNLPLDAFCAKLDPLRRISNEDWQQAEAAIDEHGIHGRFLPPMHLTTGKTTAVAIPASERIYFNGGVLVLPHGKDAVDLLEDYRRIMEAIQSRGIRTSAIGDCDQFALSIAASKQRVFRLDASFNFQANNILEGYRPSEISAVHFSGNNGASLSETIASFLQNMLMVSAQVSDPGDADYYRQLSHSIHRTVEHKLIGTG